MRHSITLLISLSKTKVCCSVCAHSLTWPWTTWHYIQGSEKLIDFITQLEDKIARDRSFGMQGAPWEFNLRDLRASGPLLRNGSKRPGGNCETAEEIAPCHHARECISSQLRCAGYTSVSDSGRTNGSRPAGTH